VKNLQTAIIKLISVLFKYSGSVNGAAFLLNISSKLKIDFETQIHLRTAHHKSSNISTKIAAPRFFETSFIPNPSPL
jgi:hypothetical protein